MALPRFADYVGIDYSGARVPEARLAGLRVYRATVDEEPREVLPATGRHWSRRGLADWLAQLLARPTPTIVGIDHGFSFPLAYFERHQLAPDWDAFLVDFQTHWPTAEPNVVVDFIRNGLHGNGDGRRGDPRWRRRTEELAGAKSVFHFDVPSQVAKSTHAGLPWLLRLRQQLGARLHVWPFDGWTPAAGRSVLAEAYPALWSDNWPRGDRTPDQHDAYAIAAWLRAADRSGALAAALDPPLGAADRRVAAVEGWILGGPSGKATMPPQPRPSRRRTNRPAIPVSTRQVLAASTYRVEPEPYLWVQARAVRTPETHLLICRDEREITVVTTAGGLADLEVISVNPDRWALLTIDCANPFYCVGFLAAIGNELVTRGVDVLMASTFSRDLLFVEIAPTKVAREALASLGLTEQPPLGAR